MIRLNYTEQDLRDENKVLEIVNSISLSKRVNFVDDELSYEQRLRKCFDFYNGKQPLVEMETSKSTYRPRVCNLTKPIVDIATQTFIGEFPNITTTGKKNEKDKISVFNQKLYNSDFTSHIFEVGKYSSKCGVGYLALFSDIGDTFPQFRELNPLYADCIYDCSLSQKHIASYFIVEMNNTSGSITTSEKVMYFYTRERVYAFKSSVRTPTNPTMPDTRKTMFVPFYAWRNGEQELAFVEHSFGDIPIVEFPNNAEYRGDAESAFQLIELYNDLLNNRGKNVSDIVNYILFLKNVRVGNEEEQRDFLNLLVNHHILASEGDNVDAKFLSNPLNQEQLQMFQNSIKDNIHYITRVPDLSSVDFSQNASDPIIKIKTKPLLDLCKEKEKWFTKPLLKVLRMILNFCRENDKDFDDYSFDLDKITLKYTHTLPSNDGDMITMITNLSNSGLANPEILLEELSFIPSVHEYLKGMVKHNEYVDNRKKELNNVNKDGGTNQTNIDRQNEKPLTKDNMDNKRNFDRGNAKTLSDEKVE